MYPSVTQVLGIFQDFSRVPPDKLAAAQERGTIIHQVCEALALGLWVPEVPKHIAPYVESLKGWWPNVEEVVAVEPQLTCGRYHFTGRPDLVCRLTGDDFPVLIDYKSPRLKNKAWRLQTAAYRHLAIHGLQIGLLRIGTLRLSPEGKPAIFDEYSGTWQADFNIFLSCLNAFNFFRKE